MGIIQHSSSKKIDVDDLKKKLAETVRRDKYNQPYSMAGAVGADMTIKKAKKSSRSKSPLGNNPSNSYSNSDIYGQDSIQMYQQEDTTPAWYKSLKKNIK